MSYTNGLDKPTDYFNTLTYTGDGTDNRSITGLGFQPDFCWFKDRTGTNSHNLFDSVRGVNKPLISNATNAELSGYNLFNSFDSDGFTISGASADNTNYNGSQFASWNWKAGGSASSNSNGSITSSVSANTTAGFSIVSFTGTGSAATIGHGLSSAPSMILIKNRSTAYSWIVYHKSLGATKNLYLDLTNAADTASIQFNDTEPTSSVFSVGTSLATNKSGDNLIAYCFAEKKGYSKFGSYTGNGNNDGAFIYTGFKPAWIMLKNTSNAQNWYIYDNKRTPTNFANYHFYADLPNAEAGGSTLGIDILSNGWKIKTSNDGWNGSGENYIYMAFAESPFVTGASAIPTTAR